MTQRAKATAMAMTKLNRLGPGRSQARGTAVCRWIRRSPDTLSVNSDDEDEAEAVQAVSVQSDFRSEESYIAHQGIRRSPATHVC